MRAARYARACRCALSEESLESLVQLVQGVGERGVLGAAARGPDRVRAIRVLRRYFLSVLDAEGSWRRAGYQDVWSYWDDVLKRMEAEGVVTLGRVCCEPRARVRCCLGGMGEVRAPVVPLLQWNRSGESDVAAASKIGVCGEWDMKRA